MMGKKEKQNYVQLREKVMPYWGYLSDTDKRWISRQVERLERCYKGASFALIEKRIDTLIQYAQDKKQRIEHTGVEITETDFQNKIRDLQQSNCLNLGQVVSLSRINSEKIDICGKLKILMIEKKVEERENSNLARAYPQLFNGTEPYLQRLIKPINQILETNKNVDSLDPADVKCAVEILYGKSETYKFKLADLTKLISLKNILSESGILQDLPSASRFLEDNVDEEFKRIIQDAHIGLKEELLSGFSTNGIETYITDILNHDDGVLKKMMRHNIKVRRHNERKAGILKRIGAYNGKYAPSSFFGREELRIINSDNALSNFVANKRKGAISRLSDTALTELLGSGGAWYSALSEELKQYVDKRRESISLGKMKVYKI